MLYSLDDIAGDHLTSTVAEPLAASLEKQKHKQNAPALPLRFAERMELLAEQSEKNKGERTRDRLKSAAARRLEEAGYHDLRVTDINEEAGVSNALFYVYFTNKQQITQEILNDFLKMLEPSPQDDMGPSDGPAEAIYRGNLGYIRVFTANPGLMRCLFQFGDQVPEFKRAWNEWNDRWIERATRGVGRNKPNLANENEVVVAVSALGSMIDALLRSLYVDHQAKTQQAAKKMGDSPEQLALLMTRLWYRALYGQEMDWAPKPSES